MEITTGIVFLMTSLYGTHQIDQNQIAAVSQSGATDSIQIESATSTKRSFKDSKEIEEFLRTAYADEPILVDIARCESTFRQYGSDGTILRGRVNKDDVGVMQINEYYHGESAKKLGYDIHTVEGNVAFGKYLYEKYGADPWKASSPCWSKTSGDIAQK